MSTRKNHPRMLKHTTKTHDKPTGYYTIHTTDVCLDSRMARMIDVLAGKKSGNDHKAAPRSRAPSAPRKFSWEA
jgi:hypothetical protein